MARTDPAPTLLVQRERQGETDHQLGSHRDHHVERGGGEGLPECRIGQRVGEIGHADEAGLSMVGQLVVRQRQINRITERELTATPNRASSGVSMPYLNFIWTAPSSRPPDSVPSLLNPLRGGLRVTQRVGDALVARDGVIELGADRLDHLFAALAFAQR